MKNFHHPGGRNFLALFLGLVLLAAVAPSAKALTGTIKGQLILDGQPAAAARVDLLLVGKRHATTVTDAAGAFQFTNVWMGNYAIEVTVGVNKFRQEGIDVKLSTPTVVRLEFVTPPPPPPPIVSPKPLMKGRVVSEEVVGDASSDEYDGFDDFASYDMDGDFSAPEPVMDREGYNHIKESRFLDVTQTPLSTFAIDVDGASFTNCRRMLLQEHRLPPASAVRVEEFINYFDYDYPQPTNGKPFSITTELAACPWNSDHELVHIGLQGKKMEMGALPPANLVFLLDVSGSMDEPDKLPLVQQGLALLVQQLRPQDRVAIVVYAGAAGTVLPSTPGNQKATILEAIDRLKAGGSTAGGEGIALAYNVARENMRKGSNSRVILCTDGDFNVGVSSEGELVKMIEQERETGVFLSVLGFGTGNLQDSKMEQLADNGNGNYAYIDQLLEAKKVFVSEVGGTLNTIAKDVKIQVEFNPAQVKSYRLVGYENRALANEDFDDDKKDAGELGAGHSVTAIYEIERAGSASATGGALRYQQSSLSPQAASGELLTVKFRYKAPDGDVSSLIEERCAATAKTWQSASENFRWSAAVAGFGMLVRDSEHKGDLAYDTLLELARGAKGQDMEGYRAECIKMVETAALLAGRKAQR